jgi:hypothetical protein
MKRRIGPSKREIPKLVKKLDTLLSLYVRERDQGRCITCKKKVSGANYQNGHFRRREHMATRFDPRNNNGQCSYCNCWLHGNEYVYGQELDKKYGPGTGAVLLKLSRGIRQWSAPELERLILCLRESPGAYPEVYQDVFAPSSRLESRSGRLLAGRKALPK